MHTCILVHDYLLQNAGTGYGVILASVPTRRVRFR